MKCNICGAELAADATFCEACGAAVTPATTEALEGDLLDAPQKNPGKVLGILSFIFSLVSLVAGLALSCCCFFTCAYFGPIIGIAVGLIFAIAGIILGAIGLKKSKSAGFKNGLALAGLIISCVFIVLQILLIIGLIIFIVFFGGIAIFEEMMNSAMYY